MDYNKANQKEESDEDNKSKDQARIDLINRGRSYVYVDNALQDCSASKYIKINKE